MGQCSSTPKQPSAVLAKETPVAKVSTASTKKSARSSTKSSSTHSNSSDSNKNNNNKNQRASNRSSARASARASARSSARASARSSTQSNNNNNNHTSNRSMDKQIKAARRNSQNGASTTTTAKRSNSARASRSSPTQPEPLPPQDFTPVVDSVNHNDRLNQLLAKHNNNNNNNNLDTSQHSEQSAGMNSWAGLTCGGMSNADSDYLYAAEDCDWEQYEHLMRAEAAVASSKLDPKLMVPGQDHTESTVPISNHSDCYDHHDFGSAGSFGDMGDDDDDVDDIYAGMPTIQTKVEPAAAAAAAVDHSIEC